MPYSGGSDPNLPDHIKKKSTKVRSIWAKTWNSSYASCIKKKKKPLSDTARSACEGQAFRIANAAIKKLELQLEGGGMTKLFYIDLAQLTAGKTFDAIVPGAFTDMYGRKVVFKKIDLEKYVKNTQEAIESTTTEGGEIVGLPIDADGHDKGDGAGWIIDAQLDGEKVRLTPKWTEIGLELIQKGIRRFFSPTVDTKYKTILGGSLTNWPATRDKKGKILLRPVELEDGDHRLLVVDENQEFEADDTDLEDSLNDEVSAVRRAFDDKFMPKREKEVMSSPWVMEVFDSYAIVREGEKHFSAPYTKNEKGEISFSARKDWIEVKRTWIEAALAQINSAVETFTNLFTKAEEDNDPPANTEEVISMDITKEELNQMIAEGVAVTMKDLMAPPVDPDADPGEGDPKPSFDMLKLFEMEDASDEFRAAVKTQMLEYYEQQRALVLEDAAKEIGKVKKESHVSEFVARVTSGSEENPQGIATEPEELKKFILSLTPDQAEYIQPLLQKVSEGKGIVPFSELGHGKKMEGTIPLPEYYAEKLRSEELELKDLQDPMLALGDLKQYDLTEFRQKEKE